MTQDPDYPPGVSDRSIAKACGELATCPCCGRSFSRLREWDGGEDCDEDESDSDNETCPRCRRGEDDRPVEEPRER